MSQQFSCLPFELHLTTAPLAAERLPGFEQLCRQAGGKALLIELARGQHCQQPMLSLVTHGHQASIALAQARQLAAQFSAAGYPVVRLKLEVPAWGAALVRPVLATSGSSYYEWHGRVGSERVEELRARCEHQGAHLSINALRQLPNARFVTLREYGSAAGFAERVAGLRHDLVFHGWALVKQQAEFCFFDSRQALDAGWLTF